MTRLLWPAAFLVAALASPVLADTRVEDASLESLQKWFEAKAGEERLVLFLSPL